MDGETGRSALCYLEASCVESPAGTLGGVELQNEEDEVIGRLDGVVFDSADRRLRYYVVTRPGLFRNRRYLLPAEHSARMAPDANDAKRTMRLDVGPEVLMSCARYDSGKIRHFSAGDTDASAGRDINASAATDGELGYLRKSTAA